MNDNQEHPDRIITVKRGIVEIDSAQIPDPEYKREAEKAYKEGKDAQVRLFSLTMADLIVDVAIANNTEKLTKARNRIADLLYGYLAKK